jgi:hypothetical protein
MKEKVSQTILTGTLQQSFTKPALLFAKHHRPNEEKVPPKTLANGFVNVLKSFTKPLTKVQEHS